MGFIFSAPSHPSHAAKIFPDRGSPRLQPRTTRKANVRGIKTGLGPFPLSDSSDIHSPDLCLRCLRLLRPGVLCAFGCGPAALRLCVKFLLHRSGLEQEQTEETERFRMEIATGRFRMDSTRWQVVFPLAKALFLLLATPSPPFPPVQKHPSGVEKLIARTPGVVRVWRTPENGVTT